MSLTIKKSELYTKCYYILWAIFCISFFVLQQSEINYMYNVTNLYQNISIIVGCSLYLLFLAFGNFKPKQLIVYACVTVIVIVSIYILNDKYIFVALGFILLASKIDIEKFVKFDLKIKLFSLVLIISLCKLGVINNYTREINGAFKQGLGFSHPNFLTALVMIILIEWFYIRYHKLKLFDYIGIAICIVIIWNIAASRTSVLTFLVIYLMVIITKAFPNIFEINILKLIISILPIIGVVISFTMVYLYGKGVPFALSINTVVTGRLKLAYNLLNKYGISLFGQFINVYGTRSVNYTSDSLFNVDMSYVLIPIRYGVCILALLIIGYYFLSKFAINKKNNMFVLAIIYFVVLGLAESYFYRIQYNFTMVFLLAYVGEKIRKKYKKLKV
ncbi:hypothetical protein [Clostridium saudiense]|uniref:hypothetical protein n=1 Tax=Clostridium saudiense TaxID=1414720 RepID=UPI00266F9726|nr:hypothetical protein [Clostridium saudiense]